MEPRLIGRGNCGARKSRPGLLTGPLCESPARLVTVLSRWMSVMAGFSQSDGVFKVRVRTGF